jgi:hypothetical protein
LCESLPVAYIRGKNKCGLLEEEIICKNIQFFKMKEETISPKFNHSTATKS